jgi:antitoxin HicB
MKVYKVPLRLEPQPEGGFTVTSPALRGLVTEGETVAEALAHTAEALGWSWKTMMQRARPCPRYCGTR